MICSMEYPFSVVAFGMRVSFVAPTARIHDCGGLIYKSGGFGGKGYDCGEMFD
jgi:hypothetical protein